MNVGRWTVLPLLLGLFFGCKSEEPKPDHFAGISSDVESLRTELKDGIFQIESVTKSLNRFATAQGDLRPPLTDLQQSVGNLDSTTERIRNLKKNLQDKQVAFQSTWSDEIKTVESANVRRTAEEGRSTIEASFNSLEQESEAVGNAYREWESKVKQIESSLAADLSTANQSALASKIKEVNDLTPRLKDRLQALSNSLEKLSGSLRSAT